MSRREACGQASRLSSPVDCARSTRATPQQAASLARIIHGATARQTMNDEATIPFCGVEDSGAGSCAASAQARLGRRLAGTVGQAPVAACGRALDLRPDLRSYPANRGHTRLV